MPRVRAGRRQDRHSPALGFGAGGMSLAASAQGAVRALGSGALSLGGSASAGVPLGRRELTWYASNTGVPSGVSLSQSGVPAMSGDTIYLNTPATYDARLFAGSGLRTIEVSAAVTITRSRLEGRLAVHTGGSVTLTDCEITGVNTSPYCDASLWYCTTKLGGVDTGYGGDATLTRCDINHWGKGVVCGAGRVMSLTDCWVHDHIVGYCDGGGAPTHMESVFVNAGDNSGVHFLRTYFDTAYDHQDAAIGGQFASASIFCHGAPHDGYSVTDCILRGGGYMTYPTGGALSNASWTGNAFVRDANFPGGGTMGVVYTAYSPSPDWNGSSGNVWTGNVWSDTGATVQPTSSGA